MQTIDSLLSQNPRYAKTTEGVWEKAEPSNFAMSVNAGQTQSAKLRREATASRAPGRTRIRQRHAHRRRQRNAALAMLVDDLIAACARAEKDYRQLVALLGD